MFQVHTRSIGRDQGRTYFLSASSHEEMQSWVGMLQALKHTRGHASTANAALPSGVPYHAPPDSGQSSTADVTPSRQMGKVRSRTAINSSTSASTLPRLDTPMSPTRKDVQSAYMPSSRGRMLSQANPNSIRNHSPFDTTDEEDYDTGEWCSCISEPYQTWYSYACTGLALGTHTLCFSTYYSTLKFPFVPNVPSTLT